MDCTLAAVTAPERFRRRALEPRRARQSKALNTPHFAAFRVLGGSLRKLQTRKVTRKVAKLALENRRRPATKKLQRLRLRRGCSTEKAHREST